MEQLMFKTILVLGAAAIGAVCLSEQSLAADSNFCAQYARLAVHEFQANVATPGCFKGEDNRWHPNYMQHYSWCLGASYEAAAGERDYRRMRVAQCRARAGYY
jgi:hypothetical protein